MLFSTKLRHIWALQPMRLGVSKIMTSNLSTQALKSVGVVGMGLMGHGIAQLASEKHQVIACDTNQQALEKGISSIKASLSKIYTKKLGENDAPAKVEQQLSNITATTKLEDLKDCDIIVEAIIENLDIKKSFYRELSQIVKPSAILASNTSSFPINELASAVESKMEARVVGLHFFNPGEQVFLGFFLILI